MPVKKAKQLPEINTEAKIKAAAHIVFRKKGFAATRTRDIAEEANINLALLNYYFRSKQKLFEIIMLESIQAFLQTVQQVFNDETTIVEHKIEAVVSFYIDLFTENPDLPLFVLSELRAHPAELIQKTEAKDIILKSYLVKQLQQGMDAGKIMAADPLHYIMNIIGMTVFPFVGSALLKAAGGLSDQKFNELMAERKTLIPKWIKATLIPG